MKILIVSGHALIGESLVTLVENLPLHGPVKAACCAAAGAIGRARGWRPDAILVEATMDAAGTLFVVSALTKALPDARVVVLGAEGDHAAVHAAVEAGAVGYLTRDASPGVLAGTLEGVMRGELGLSRVAALHLVRHLRRAASAGAADRPVDALDKLTHREREILDLMRRGLRSREIGERLFIAEATVYKHIQHILEKLQVHSRTQAILMAERRIEHDLPPDWPAGGLEAVPRKLHTRDLG